MRKEICTLKTETREDLYSVPSVCLSACMCVFRLLPCFFQMCSCAVSPPEPTGSPDQAPCWTAPRRSSHPSWTHFSTRLWTTRRTAVWCRYQSCRLIGRLLQEEVRLWSDWPGKSRLKWRRKWLAMVFCPCMCFVLCFKLHCISTETHLVQVTEDLVST